MLTVDHGTGLKRADWILKLLQNDCTKEVRLLLDMRFNEQAVRDANNIAPQRFPLILQVPHIGSLEQRNDQPLWLHEDQLGCSYLCVH
ncbi:hypothetical protein AO501_23255 [Mycobacterium gordonae]|uniref:Uncharacterized protein n=1 Tax=Mycobacterium gordonae TaxID=1778 RepID=A0A0Q2RLB1_MYCGO|nr:hypothetical protein AO501_23255 [Mycobacterium gordonae]